MKAPDTLFDLLASSARVGKRETAIVAPGQTPLCYGELQSVVQRFASTMRDHGVVRQDRVALLLPDGAELAISFLATASTAACAPLSLRSPGPELRSAFERLSPRFVIGTSATKQLLRELRLTREVTILELRGDGTGAPGVCSLQEAAEASGNDPGTPGPDDVALILSTSGTTESPKLVPLTQANLSAAALNYARDFGLSPGDRCLNVMPLHRIGALVSNLLGSIAAGASIFLTPGFSGPSFFDWLSESGATWFNATPPMHRTLLAIGERHAATIKKSRLRFARSGTSAMSAATLRSIERMLGVPVLEGYGMTETCGRFISNPPLPRARRLGSVGAVEGHSIRLIDSRGGRVQTGQCGEIAVRGQFVFNGYLDDDPASPHPLRDGWFHTGDLGRIDEDGYLFIEGRLNETINRGGDKVMPAEVESVLESHPKVARAVVFPVPDERLGEEGGAIVVASDSSATRIEIREHVALHLAEFKVPRLLVLADDIPTEPGRKLQRRHLAERLGLSVEPGDHDTGQSQADPDAFPDTEIEALLKST